MLAGRLPVFSEAAFLGFEARGDGAGENASLLRALAADLDLVVGTDDDFDPLIAEPDVNLQFISRGEPLPGTADFRSNAGAQPGA